MLVSFELFVLLIVVVTALPAIHRSVGGSIATLEWAVNAYALTFAAGIITCAALGDRLGRRRVYVAGLSLFTVASALCAVAPDSGLLIAFRAAQGLGAAAVTPLALTIIAATFPLLSSPARDVATNELGQRGRADVSARSMLARSWARRNG